MTYTGSRGRHFALSAIIGSPSVFPGILYHPDIRIATPFFKQDAVIDRKNGV